MALTLNAEQQLLRDNAREFVRATAPVPHLRRLRDSGDRTGFSCELWRQMAEFGWPGSIFPEAYGGMGLGYTELGIVMEECGRTLTPAPFLSSVLLAGGVLMEAGSEAQKQSLLPRLCSGELLLSLAFEESARFQPYHVSCKAERNGNSFKLQGHKRFVLDGHAAQRWIVSARTSGAAGDRHGISLFLVDPAQPGVRCERTQLLDGSAAAQCSFEAVQVSSAELIGRLDTGADILAPVLDRASIALGAALLGVLTQAFETTLEYMKTRVQFDVPIGSFQALQHRAVDMFCELELCKSLVAEALSAIDSARADVPALASAVKARLTDASRWITREAVQLHGGIGMTDEHDIGLYLKRAALAELTLGDSAYHRDRFATLRGF
jgi:alkylation response protein AidB-like acyl-CoA dehydrogenase